MKYTLCQGEITMNMKFLPLLIAAVAFGCSNDNSSQVGTGASGGPGGGGTGGLSIKLDGSTGTGGSGGTNGTSTLAPGQLMMMVRDFKFYDANDPSTDPDFENVPKDMDSSGNPMPAGQTSYGPWDDKNIVTDTLGDDFKPVYKPSDKSLTTHGKDAFNKWFNTVDGTNKAIQIPLTLSKNSNGTYSYDSQSAGAPLSPNGGFFPIDDGAPYGSGFGNQGQDGNGVNHNFSFTVEIHTVFNYSGGEVFHFSGDDDVFVYIDKKLVINLGGIHGRETADVSLDSLKLTKGKNYQLDFFYAERHVVQSNLLITTTLNLSTNPNIPIY
jgi:fibro-slime domain-containing protein